MAKRHAKGRPIAPLALSVAERAHLERQVRHHRVARSLSERYDVSRWGRFQDADESAYYEYICRRAGISVQYCAEQFENDGSPVSTIVKGVKRAMAGEYSREPATRDRAANAPFKRMAAGAREQVPTAVSGTGGWRSQHLILGAGAVSRIKGCRLQPVTPSLLCCHGASPNVQSLRAVARRVLHLVERPSGGVARTFQLPPAHPLPARPEGSVLI